MTPEYTPEQDAAERVELMALVQAQLASPWYHRFLHRMIAVMRERGELRPELEGLTDHEVLVSIDAGGEGQP